jgi:hypothetical protein
MRLVSEIFFMTRKTKSFVRDAFGLICESVTLRLAVQLFWKIRTLFSKKIRVAFALIKIRLECYA